MKCHEEEKPCLLIVEDDVDMLDYLVLSLNEEYEVLSAENGREGLNKALEHIPDLVITDIMMPLMDGIELAHELKTNMCTSHIPIVMLTAKDTVESQIEGLGIGIEDYVTKPFPMELLEARIKNLLKTRSILREKYLREFDTNVYKLAEHGMEHEFMSSALCVTQEHMLEFEFSPEDFAKHMGMSLRSLQRKLKAVADRTPAKFINEIRMVEAARLLANSSLTITEITYQVGFGDSGNFARQFRQYFDQSPSHYRADRQA